MPISIDELQSLSVPVLGACSGVYFLFNDAELVYVGQGWNCFLRVAEHTRKEFDQPFTHWTFMAIESEFERRAIAGAFRRAHKPRYNKK